MNLIESLSPADFGDILKTSDDPGFKNECGKIVAATPLVTPTGFGGVLSG
jgi:hypothetical protein